MLLWLVGYNVNGTPNSVLLRVPKKSCASPAFLCIMFLCSYRSLVGDDSLQITIGLELVPLWLWPGHRARWRHSEKVPAQNENSGVILSASRNVTRPAGKLHITPIRQKRFIKGSWWGTPPCQAVYSPSKNSTHQDTVPRPSQHSSDKPLRGMEGKVTPSSQYVFPVTSISQ